LLPLFVTTGVYLFFNALAFYLIAYHLVKKFLSERRILLFTALALAVMLLCSAGLSAILYLMFHKVEEVKNNMGYVVIGAFSSTGLTVSFLTAIKLITLKVKQDAIARRSEQQRLESELRYLKAQINPHFLFNAINSIYILINKDPQKASDTLIKLSDLLRFQLYDCSEEKIAIEKEMEYIRNYIILEKVRRGDKLKIEVNLEGDFSGFLIAPFLFMPLLENSFKFVSNHDSRSNEIKVHFKKNDSNLVATFYNTKESLAVNGVGGIGLKNVGRRLELLYPRKHALEIEQTEEYFQAALSLELS
jgi:two-component system LytT family sensor kinase